MYRCALWGVGTSLGSRLLRQKNAKISARETNRTKKSMSTTAQTYWPSSAEIWEGQRNYSLKHEVDKDAISCFSIRKDWRFAVRAKSFAPHWRSRGFFRGHVRSCEKGLIPVIVHSAFSYFFPKLCLIFKKSISGPIKLKFSGKTLNSILLAPIYFLGVYF